MRNEEREIRALLEEREEAHPGDAAHLRPHFTEAGMAGRCGHTQVCGADGSQSQARVPAEGEGPRIEDLADGPVLERIEREIKLARKVPTKAVFSLSEALDYKRTFATRMALKYGILTEHKWDGKFYFEKL